MVDRRDIKFAPEEYTEDRSWCGEGKVVWIDLVWNNFRLEPGHTMDDKEWSLMYRGKAIPRPADERGVCFLTVRSIRKAKTEILKILEG